MTWRLMTERLESTDPHKRQVMMIVDTKTREFIATLWTTLAIARGIVAAHNAPAAAPSPAAGGGGSKPGAPPGEAIASAAVPAGDQHG